MTKDEARRVVCRVASEALVDRVDLLEYVTDLVGVETEHDEELVREAAETLISELQRRGEDETED